MRAVKKTCYILATLFMIFCGFSTKSALGRTKHFQPPDLSRYAGFHEYGMGSWYGAEQGKKTANGERFNQEAMTCAHKTLPLGSIITVTNLDTHLTTKCRVNDRGPYPHGRIVDATKAVARKIDAIKKGVYHVMIAFVGYQKKIN